jgi:ankyrin repeat protein
LNKSTEGVVLLLQAGCKIEQENERGTPLHAAIVTGQVLVVTALLDKKADPQRADKQWGMKAVHTAAFVGKPEIIQLLIARKGTIS